MNWQTRITGYSEEPPDQLLANPRNPRRHPGRQRDVMRDVLDELGFVAPVIVNDNTGFLIDGHLRVEEALTAGARKIPVIHVELSEAEEAEAIATLDPISAMARYDRDRLEELLADVHSDSDAVNALLQELTTVAEVVDAGPGGGIASGELPMVKTLVLVYEEDQWDELMEGLRQVPGDSAAAKVLTMVRTYEGD